MWLAADRFRANARVAVKLVPSEDGRIDALRREFLTLARLAHPGIARVRDFGLLAGGGGAYFTSDHVAGGNLLEWAGALRGLERWRALLAIACQALSVLQYLSLRGLRHGDVKPANLLVEEDPEAPLRPRLKVIDFGMAQLRARADGFRGGTPAYLPPPISAADAGRAAPIDPDLFALGLSLFHAGTGRLPFALGDPDARQAWLAAGEPPRARACDPAAPAAMDDLIAGLTAFRGAARFRSAAEAIEFLRGKVSLPPSPRPSMEGAASSGRESLIDEVLGEIVADPPRRAAVLWAPLELGRMAILEALEARLQALGWPVVSFAPGSISRALRAAADVLGVRSEALYLDAHALEAALAAPSARLAVLADEEALREAETEGFAAAERFLAAAARLATASPGGGAVILVAATDDPAALARRLGIPESAFSVHAVEPLAADAIHDLAREFFAVESVPDEVVRRIEAESRGVPGLVREALESLAAAGVAADFLGHLAPPAELPDRLVRSAAGSFSPAALPPELREALALLALAGEPLAPAELALRFPAPSAEEWRRRLESLRARGYLRREEEYGGDAVYRMGPGIAPDVSTLLGPGEEAARRSLVARLSAEVRRARRAPVATYISLARNTLISGDLAAAIGWARKAAREAARGKGEVESAEVLARVLESAESAPPESARAGRALLLLRLRGAQALMHASRTREALRFLDRGSPPAWATAFRRLRAEVHERAGDVEAAAREIGIPPAPAEDGPGDGAEALEDLARLAALHFKAGRGRDGRAVLEDARARLGALLSNPGLVAGARAARILGLLAGVESAHGERKRAMTLLEEWLRVTRGWLRGDVPLAPLNELGILYAEEERPRDSLSVFVEIEKRARAGRDRMSVLKAVHNQAIIHYRMRDLDRAEERFREARRIADALGPGPFSATVLLGFAGVLRERGRLVEALRLYRKLARPGFPGEGAATRDRALALNNIAELYLSLGRLDRSLLHANQAYRAARRTDDRFLRGLTLRFRGIARWALGRAADAARDLERARGMALVEGDWRGGAICEHFLALLAGARGDEEQAIRGLRAAVALSRRAEGNAPPPGAGAGFSQCFAHLPAARAALFGELLRRGRRRAARFLLLLRPRRSPEAEPSLGLRAAAARASEEWPENHEDLAADCRRAARAGLVWDAFRTLADALRDPRLAGEARAALVLERDVIAARLLRFVPRRHEAAFGRFWDLAGEPLPAAETPTAAGREPPPAPPQADPPGDGIAPVRAILENGSGGVRSLLPLLARLRAVTGASAVWLIDDPVAAKRPLVAGESRGGLKEILGEHAQALARARAHPGPVASGARLFFKLPHATAARVVCAEGPSTGWARSPAVRAGLVQGAASLALAVRLLEVEEVLRAERDRSERAESELHRLHALLAKGAQLETELISRQIELRDLERTGSAGAGGSARKRLVAASPVLRAILARLRKVAAGDIPLLLVGESGVGKDLIARWVHEASPRAERPFVAELCNVPESLVEAELFGYERGAFTGAVADRPGLFQRAAGGTLYLDEVFELPAGVQAKCLRALDEKSVRPLGSDRACPVDFRLISSSRLPLAELESSSRMRKDFFYRIKAEVIEIPPLRDRKEDIRAIAGEVLREWAAVNSGPIPYLHPAACERLEEHSWPGNARELVNELQRVLIMSPIEITPDMLFAGRESFPGGGAGGRREGSVLAARVPGFKEERHRVERALLVRALETHRGNATRAAGALQITRRYLGTLLEKHGIDLKKFRAPPAGGSGDRRGERAAGPASRRRRKAPREKEGRRRRPGST